MRKIMKEEIEKIKKEYQDLLQKLSDPELFSNWKKAKYFSQKKEVLEKIINTEKELNKTKDGIQQHRSVIAEGQDEKLISLAQKEMKQLKKKEKRFEKELKNLITEYGKPGLREEASFTSKAVITEIRAGTGGEEAALFSKDLFRMYSRYAKSQNWEEKILDSRPTELGGFKEIIFELRDGNVYPKMKYEAGVHRVQRVPETEKSGRIHTSTATVAILPKPKNTEIEIKNRDLKIETFRASGPGGQYVNKRDTAVRITHLPTGLVVSSQNERSQAQNKENALVILEARILKKRQQTQAAKISKKRKTQIGWAERAEKIRTYNFPQNRVTDHRIEKSWHNLEEVLDGKLDPVIKKLRESEY